MAWIPITSLQSDRVHVFNVTLLPTRVSVARRETWPGGWCKVLGAGLSHISVRYSRSTPQARSAPQMARGVAGVTVPISSHRGLVHTVRFGPPRQLQTGWCVVWWNWPEALFDGTKAPRAPEAPGTCGMQPGRQAVLVRSVCGSREPSWSISALPRPCQASAEQAPSRSFTE